jgi:hypothetical protein
MRFVFSYTTGEGHWPSGSCMTQPIKCIILNKLWNYRVRIPRLNFVTDMT